MHSVSPHGARAVAAKAILAYTLFPAMSSAMPHFLIQAGFQLKASP
jgi:hypothetical protein